MAAEAAGVQFGGEGERTGRVREHAAVWDGEPAELGTREALAKFAERRRNRLRHHRGGIDRASLIAACILAVHGIPPHHVLAQIAQSRGCPVPDTEEQRAWVSSRIGV